MTVPQNLSPLFSWRAAICDSDLPPTARHVALTLSLHMNERGGSCFPSVMVLVAETGLSERTVRSMLKLLGSTGWLTKQRRRRENGSETSCLYSAAVPGGPVQQLHPPLPNSCTPPVQEVHPQRTSSEDDTEDVATTTTSRRATERADESFELWWLKYPKKANGKGEARARWRKMLVRDREAAADGLERHVAWWTEHGTQVQYIPSGAVWLNQRRWEDEQPRNGSAVPPRPTSVMERVRLKRAAERENQTLNGARHDGG